MVRQIVPIDPPRNRSSSSTDAMNGLERSWNGGTPTTRSCSATVGALDSASVAPTVCSARVVRSWRRAPSSSIGSSTYLRAYEQMAEELEASGNLAEAMEHRRLADQCRKLSHEMRLLEQAEASIQA